MERPEIRRERLDSPVVQTLIRALNAELSQRYPEEGANHFRLDAEEIAPGSGALFVAYIDDQAIGCGAVRAIEYGAAEIKRMYVSPEMRGRGVGKTILAALEKEALSLGATRLVLETGSRQPEALALYQRAGFNLIPAFGEYVGCVLSVCLEKRLTS